MRRFTEHDISALREIDRLSFGPEDQYDGAFYKELVGSNHRDAIIATLPDGTIAGWVLADLVTQPVRIRSLSVHPQFRRRGFGRALITEILRRHNTEVDLLVDAQNFEALNLYSAIGFITADCDPEMPHRIRMVSPIVREEQSSDRDAIRAVHDAAFGRDAEGRLVERLRDDGLIVSSVVARMDSKVVASAVFSRLKINTQTAPLDAVALAPVAVAPRYQHRGMGSRIIKCGLQLCAERGYVAAFVLGDPRYYMRFGFSHDIARPVRSPYSQAGAAWMALGLREQLTFSAEAQAEYPTAFTIVD